MRAQIGSYRIEQVLGNGGMGVVYKGWHDALGRHAAIKTFLPNDGTSSEQRKRLLAEGQAQARLQHPNVITVYDLFEYDGELFIAMEYVEGQSLAQILDACRGGCMSLDEALPLIEQILVALEYIHSKNVIHRDVKPSNVMVCNGVVKVMDFGIAIRSGAPRLTAAMRAPGTPLYMSPEQLQAKDIDHRTDIYSAAILLYRMLAGRVPFASKEYLAQIHERLAGPPDLQELVPTLPAGVCKAIAIALSYEAGERFSRAAQFRDALREGAIGFLPVASQVVDDSLATQLAPDGAPAQPVAETRSRKGAMIAWAVIGSSVAAGSAVLVDQLSRPPITQNVPPRSQSTSVVALPTLAVPEMNVPILPDKRTPAPKKKTPGIGGGNKFRPLPAAVDKRKPDVESLRDEIRRGLLRAETDNRLQQFESALHELDGVDGKIRLEPSEFRSEAETSKTLRAAATSGALAQAKRKQQEEMWQARIADIELDLSKGQWLEVQRYAQDILDANAPEPFAARARELRRQGEKGLVDTFEQDGKVGETTNTVVRKPSSPPRKKE